MSAEQHGNGHVPWTTYHADWKALREDMAEQAQEHSQLLMEIRESIGDWHTRFESLPCQAHEERWAAMAADIATLKGNSINWHWMVAWVNRKTVWGIVVIVAGKVGWDISGGKAIIDLGGK